ncbi:cobalamin-binding protein [Peribacillus sp. SCS-155]|uniref:cobalamin-binding protein n=1 Tax=Peribacillus sedimenti TaxID=3115297 RepID=UPI0039064B23
MKVISICPSNTELCAYLGIESDLIAIDDYSDYPDTVTSLPRLGPDLSINMDLVEELKPDIVLASLSVPGMEKNVEELKKRGIPHITLNPQSLQDIAADLVTLGEAVGIRERAEERAAYFLDAIQKFKDISETIEYRPSLYWEWWPNPLFSPGGINWLTEISRLAGGYNIFEDIELASIQIPSEDVIRRNPDYICLAWVGVPLKRINPAVVKKRHGWSHLSAVAEDKILIMEEPLYCRPSPRLLEGVEKLAKLLHPNEFAHIL